MKRNDSICPLLTIAANADASNQGTAVPCDPEHCMLAARGKEQDVWTCGLNQCVNRLAQGVSINCIEVDGKL